MQKIKKLFTGSLESLKITRNLTICGLMAALSIVLSYVARIELGPYIRIGFSGIPNRIVEYLFGPVIGCIFGGALDILKYILKPTGPFCIGLTLNVMLAGIIYGLMLYKKPVKLWRIALTEFIIKLVINCILNTLSISMLYGKGFFVMLPARILSNAIMLPIDTVILYLILRFISKNRKHFT